ncbi:Ultraviolet-B receptor UVR8 [Platanthera guangdongensis]|uniref:Ultraviolet-B receptor UVR8 n=1 Tax=Platanthera guangdongensis TaxID=2320717 RepID=A0ABR2M1E6_9ASPA
MQQHQRISNGDISRLSVSSAPSCSSQGSGPDEIESLGDVYVWGEVWSDVISPDGRGDSVPSKIDVLIPKPLESNVVLDVHQIACGSRNMALVTRQGEVFTWGEESGGRLGHGVSIDVSRPRLVESLAPSNIDSVACGETHSCAINTWGDLFAWGTGLLGHGGGGDVSHWIPKRVSGPLEGMQVLSVACGAWHSALTTSNGRIYTFGDGTFGALGHGDRESAGYPREIEGLSGLRGVKVACGVWHTAAIVEVMEQAVAGTNVASRKLFTWGDGDKYRLGQGDKEARLLPSCVPSLIDYSFHELACGDNITVALTTSGHVFTMGSSAHGQLGNPQSDGKLPCLVQDRLVGELVEEIACGSHHVVVLTSRSEVYSWGRGDNGRLGHGDRDDRKTPAVVEALRDRHVRSISCGSNFTACICVHKWVSGADQSVCTACRLTFGFTKKRHNCYNCGLVHCHACSSKKALKAALAPTPGKPHRVCDSCYSKLKAAELGGMPSAASRKSAGSRQSIDSRDSRFDRGEVRYSSRLLLAPTQELGSHRLDVIRNVGKNEHRTSSSQVSSPSHMAFTSSMSLIQTALKPVAMTPPPPATSSRFVNPYYTWRASPSQSAAHEFSGSMVETMKKTNEHLDREVLKLQGQVKSLKQKLEQQGSVAQMALKKAEEASSIAADEHAKFSAAVELMKTFQGRMNDMEDGLPSDLVDNFRAMLASSESSLRNNRGGVLALSSSSSSATHRDDLECTTGVIAQENDKTAAVNYIKEASSDHGGSMENGLRSPRTSTNSHGEVQLTEQFEPGVYVTLAQLRDGTKVFKRVRFSKRRFAEQQAEEWWRENQGRVLKKYSYPPGHNRSYSTSHAFPEASSSSSLMLLEAAALHEHLLGRDCKSFL